MVLRFGFFAMTVLPGVNCPGHCGAKAPWVLSLLPYPPTAFLHQLSQPGTHLLTHQSVPAMLGKVVRNRPRSCVEEKLSSRDLDALDVS